MANLGSSPMAATTSLFVVAILLLNCLHSTEAQVGVVYGRDGSNLPSPQDVVNLYKNNGIGSMRIYFPHQPTLQAIQGSGIKLALGVPNDDPNNGDVQSLGSNPSAADQWVRNNVVPYASSIKYIVVGNEIDPSNPKSSSILPAMQNILYALNSHGLGGQIKISTSIGTSLVVHAYPPSNGQFNNRLYITPIVDFLKSNGAPLMVNIYPYFAYVQNQAQISLDYALFTSPGTVVTDSNNGLHYQNLFDALADAVYAALDKVGAPELAMLASESGWGSDGGVAATHDNARTYYRNLINHVRNGTPRRPGRAIETFLFAMFDEDQKPGDQVEHHFGLFNPDKTPKYDSLNFS